MTTSCRAYAALMPADDPFSHFDREYVVGGGRPNRAFFGRDVLRGLVDGIEDHVAEPRSSYRVGAPVLLGCSPWVNDFKLFDAIRTLGGACIVISKPPRDEREAMVLRRLGALNAMTPGVELRALSGLGHMAPKVDGKPMVFGPGTEVPEFQISTFRTVGYRRTGPTFPPIAHAKLALLGNVCWTDEHPAGGVDDYLWIEPKRLWVSSANFTHNSRSSLEFGYWTDETALVASAQHFLGDLIGASEGLASASDAPNPDLAMMEFDDAAFIDYLAETQPFGFGEDEDDD